MAETLLHAGICKIGQLRLCYKVGSTLLEAQSLPAIRPAAVAGAFYPGAAIELERQIGIFLGSAGTGANAPRPRR